MLGLEDDIAIVLYFSRRVWNPCGDTQIPQVEVVFFAEEDGSAPALEWLDGLPQKTRDKFIVRMERLAECGNELRRPEADLLRDGIYELRVRSMRVNYRMLYFFHERVAVLSHGIQEEAKVPDVDIERAWARRRAFGSDPEKYTYGE